MLEALDAAAVRRWCAAAVDGLTACRRELDDMNVYPVPDGDTGTNLLLTMTAAWDALRAGGDTARDAGSAVGLMARGAVLGARGNSGVILSQLLRGIAEVLGAAADADGAALAAGLDRAAALAYASVAEPVEGTVLSVARAAAEAALALPADSGRPAPLGAVVGAAHAGAATALARTPSQLPALAAAGVVDAGGCGLLVLLEALAGVVGAAEAVVRPARRVARERRMLEAVRETGSTEYAYEVQYLLTAVDGAVDALRGELAELGDSLVVVGTGDGRWNVHVHVNDVGAAIEAGVEAGRPQRITVTRFADQQAAALERTGVAVVAVAPGEGLAGLFEAEGVVVVDGGPTGDPSTDEVFAAIEGTGAAAVVVLPNSGAATGVAGAAAARARDRGIEAAVVPTRSAVQGLSAVAVHDESRRFGDDVIAMAEAAAATRWAEVTVATRDALTMAGPCRAGDVLGLAEGDVVLIGASVDGVARELVDRMLVLGGELLTVVVGADATADLGAAVRRHVRATHPEVEVGVYAGGQPRSPLLLGVE